MKKLLLLLIATSIVTGCVSPYVAPSPEGNATLEFDGNSLPSSAFAMFTNGSDCSGKAKIPEGSNFYKGNHEPLVIQAGKEFAFTIFTTRGLRYCSVITSFLPQPNTHYVAVAGNNAEVCYINVFKRLGMGPGSKLEPETTQRAREPKPSWSENGSFCKP